MPLGANKVALLAAAGEIVPDILSVSGEIVYSWDRTISVTVDTELSTDYVDVTYYNGATLVGTNSNVSIGAGTFILTPPTAVRDLAVDTVATIKVKNIPGKESTSSQSRTIKALPSGGTITTTGNYRVHDFTSSGSFVTPVELTDVEYLIVGGGGGGGSSGYVAGGGGGGGFRTSVVGATSGANSSAESRITVASGTHAVTVAATASASTQGNDSTFQSITALGGGGGTSGYHKSGASGGCGSGASAGNNAGNAGSGTAGQGQRGGYGSWNPESSWTGGAGGASGVGDNGNGGGAGLNSSITGSSIGFSGGAGGFNENAGNGAGATAFGGGSPYSSGTANTGGGGGGGSGSGGSGRIIVRYVNA